MGPVGAILLGNGSRWGFVLGLATQPFWFYTSFRHRQWGIFIASIFYALELDSNYNRGWRHSAETSYE